MELLKQYILPFGTFENGIHKLTYIVGKEFFEEFEHSEVQEGNLNVDIVMNKKTQHFELDFSIKGVVYIQCDRCLDYFHLTIDSQEKLIVKFGDEDSDITDVDNVLIIARSKNEMQLAQHIYEYINLSLPIQRIHPEDVNGDSICDPKMIEKLEEHLISDKQQTDPRWDQLKSLINNY